MKNPIGEIFRFLVAGTACIIIFAALLLTSCSTSETGSSANDGQILFIGDDIAVVETVYGKVKGFILRDIYQFRGITLLCRYRWGEQVHATKGARTLG